MTEICHTSVNRNMSRKCHVMHKNTILYNYMILTKPHKIIYSVLTAKLAQKQQNRTSRMFDAKNVSSVRNVRALQSVLNISFTFQEIKNLSAHPIYLRFVLFRIFFFFLWFLGIFENK